MCKRFFYDKWYEKIILITIAFRILVQMLVPLWVQADFSYDDLLMVLYAEDLINLDWLGEYNHMTLNKMPGFAIFLATMKSFNIPYMLGIGALYSFASYLFYRAIRKLIKNKVVVYVAFVYVLFSPVMFDDNITQRVYRNSILPALSLITISCFLGLFLERNKSLKRRTIWSIGAGCGYLGYSLTVENNLWLTCFCFGATFIVILLYIIENKKTLRFKKMIGSFLIVLVPFIMCNVGLIGLKTVNYFKYGVYAVSDWNDTYFAKMGKAMIQIDYGEDIPGIYVNRATLEKLYTISPNLSEFKDYFDKVYANEQTLAYKNGEIERDFIMWYFRWGADSLGVYSSAEEANEFYKQIYLDIESAFEQKILNKKEQVVFSNLAGPLDFKDLDLIIAYSLRGMKEIVLYEDLNVIASKVSGDENYIVRMSEVVTTPVCSPEEQKYRTDSDLSFERKKVDTINILITVYQKIALIIAVVAILIYFTEFVINIYKSIRKKSVDFSMWIIKTGLLLTIWACTMSMALIYYEVTPNLFKEYYAAGVFPVWQVFVCISLANIEDVYRILKNSKNNVAETEDVKIS